MASFFGMPKDRGGGRQGSTLVFLGRGDVCAHCTAHQVNDVVQKSPNNIIDHDTARHTYLFPVVAA